MHAQDAIETFDAVVVGGGPAGATAAQELARDGHKVLLLDKAGRIKPCGGAIPTKALSDFQIPEDQLVAKVKSARIVSPRARCVDMPVGEGFVGMVDREQFDEWLRDRAALVGAERRTGTFQSIEREVGGSALVVYRPGGKAKANKTSARVRARIVIGADGANSLVAKQEVPGGEDMPHVFAYHEIVKSPPDGAPSQTTGSFDGRRCDVYYQGDISPDFYGWVFPHGATTSVGMGSAAKGLSLRGATQTLRARAGLADAETIRCEGAPIPLKPLKRWDNGKDVLLTGDAAGVVAPASGEGIYYAMLAGRFCAQAADKALATGDARELAKARKRFMKLHGQVFWVLGIMQRYWYASDRRRERFVRICEDKDVQRLTWDGYMNKELIKADPLAHARIFWKNIFHLAGVAPV